MKARAKMMAIRLKCSKCKKRYHLKAWLQKHKNSCSGKEPTRKCKAKLSEHQRKTRKVLSSLGFDDFFASECVPSVITFLNKISATSSETTKIRGSREIYPRDVRFQPVFYYPCLYRPANAINPQIVTANDSRTRNDGNM